MPSSSRAQSNSARSVEARIDDLISRLTLGEKVGQLMHASPAVERLGLPEYNWWSEACHGVGRNGRATVFPQVIGLGATWDRKLVHAVATAVSDEARAKHHAAAAENRRGQYQGLTFWTPNINIFRDPRWGRGQETFGEDPYLTAELGVAMVRGLQGDDPAHLKTAACAKHFAVHSGPEAERHTFDARPTPKDLTETYLPAFERLVQAGVEAVMGAYNRVDGEPCCGSRFLLVETLRKQWGFKGHVVSDCGAVDDFHKHHQVTRDAAESAALAVNMGCDLNCGCTYNALYDAVQRRLITEKQIDISLRRLLVTRFKLGLLEPPKRKAWTSIGIDVVDSAAHRALARRAAAESVVLLKNTEGLLPLRSDPASLLVVGPGAANVNVLLGNYYGVSSRLVTLLEGIMERVAEGTRVEYRAGCSLTQPAAPGINYTFGAAADCEVVVAVLGLDPTVEGEEGDAIASPCGGDRDRIELPAGQLEFLRELRRNAKKLVLVLTGGSAVAIPEAHDLCDAVLQVWYPGCEGGRAVADVLFGQVCPSGRLPVTVPRHTEDLPAFTDYSMRDRTYRFANIEPLYPFGFGLSYVRFAYEKIEASASRLGPGAGVTVKAAVRNTGSRAATEVVQCYVRPPENWPEAPRAILVGFEKVKIPARKSVTVRFELTEAAFRQVDHEGRRVRVPGRYELVVGPASPGVRAMALGAPPPVAVSVTLTGT